MMWGWTPELRRFDLPLATAIALLALVGLFGAYTTGGEPLMYRHLTRLAIAALVLIALAHVPSHQYARWSIWVYLFTLLLLVAVILFGASAKGAQRWLVFGGVQFQPAEIAKIATPLMVASFLARREGILSFPVVVGALFIIALPVALVGSQPDFGTAFIIAAAGAALLFIADTSWRMYLTFALAALASAPLAWYLMEGYQRARVLAFLNPEQDPLGSGYHIIQSKIAIGSGGLYGKGWLAGTQSQLDFLPERSTDFVFAVFAEEFGLVGAALLLVLFAVVFFRGLWLAGRSQELFGRLVGAGLVLSLFIHVFVNIGMTSGLLPVVGLPLPLISYGGSSLVTTMAAFGIVMSMYSHRRLLAE